MNELEIAKNALEHIVGYYRRSHKHGENTIYQMYREAEVALQEMSRLTKRAADGLNREGDKLPSSPLGARVP